MKIFRFLFVTLMLALAVSSARATVNETNTSPGTILTITVAEEYGYYDAWYGWTSWTSYSDVTLYYGDNCTIEDVYGDYDQTIYYVASSSESPDPNYSPGGGETWQSFDQPQGWSYGDWSPDPSGYPDGQTFEQSRTNTQWHYYGEISNLGNVRNDGWYQESNTEYQTATGTAAAPSNWQSFEDVLVDWHEIDCNPDPSLYWEDQTFAQYYDEERTVRRGESDQYGNERNVTVDTELWSSSRSVSGSRPLNDRSFETIVADWHEVDASPSTGDYPMGTSFTQTYWEDRDMRGGRVNDRDGEYDVTTWTDHRSGTRPATGTANTSPTASISGSTSLVVGETGSWDFGASDSDGNLYRWRFHSSTNPSPQWTYISGGSVSGSYSTAFSTPGDYTWVVDVEDDAGGSDSASLIVHVNLPNHAPSVSLGLDPTVVLTNGSVTVTAGAHDDDGNFDSMGVRWLNHGQRQLWNLNGVLIGSDTATDRTRSYTETMSVGAGTEYLRNEVWDTSSAGTTGDWEAVTVLGSWSPSVAVSPSSLSPSGTLTVTFGDAPSPQSWLGIYNVNDTSNSAPLRSGTIGHTGAGTMDFTLGSDFAVGQDYVVRLFPLTGPYNPMAASGSFHVVATSANAPAITSPLTASGALGTAFNYAITASNSPTSFSATGLPPGLTLGGNTISGAPTQTGTFNVTLSASNAGGASAPATLALAIAKATPVGTFASQTFYSPTTITASILNASFAAPSAGLPAPTGAITYSAPTGIIGTTSPALGRILAYGPPCPVTATIAGDANYASASVVGTFSVVDNVPPVWLYGAGLQQVLVGATSFSLAWNPAYDAGGIGDYQVSVTPTGGAETLLMSNGAIGLVVPNLTPNTVYAVKVRVKDQWGPNGGNWSTSWSDPITIATLATPPGPTNGTAWASFGLTGPGTAGNDGLRDEIIAPGTNRFYSSIIDWSTTVTVYTTYDVNSQFFIVDYPVGDGTSLPGWGVMWVPQVLITNNVLEETDVVPEFQFIVDPGYEYRFYALHPDGSWSLENKLGPFTADEASVIQDWILEVMSGSVFSSVKYYLVRMAKPFAKTAITIGSSTINVGANGAAAGPITVPLSTGGSATVNLGTGAGSVTLSDGTVVSVSSSGVVTVNGSPVSIGSTTIGGVGLQVDTSGGTLTIPAGPTVHVNPDGSGSIALPSGAGINVASNGHLSLNLPPGTPQTIVQAVDILGKVLQPGKGAVISVKDVLGALGVPGAVIPLPGSGAIQDIPVAITSKGVFQVGVSLGNGSDGQPVVFWFDVTTAPKPAVAVDANRDGAIDGNDTTSVTAPYRFWLNDDIDRTHTFNDTDFGNLSNTTDQDEDDIGATEASQNLMSPDCWTDNKADSKRDLEDFTRLQISTAGLNDSFKNGQLFLGLKWTDVSTGNPGIRVYPQHDTTGSLNYLTDDAEATAQVGVYAVRDVRYQNESDSTSLHTLVRGSETFILPPSLFSNLSEANPKTCLLFEGVEAGKGQLKLVILKQENGSYTEIGEGPGVWMELKKIGDMYEHWSVGNASGGAPAAVAGRIASESGSGSAFSYTAASLEEQKYILFVHGWNMEKWEKERFAETAYKRLWWQGYKGRFGLFSWPATNNFSGGFWKGLNDGTNFDRGEWSAWRSGAPLRQLLQTLNSAYGGELYVFSHSMGGIVVGEALRLQSDSGGGQIAKVYVASQAALSAHVYDGTLPETTPNGLQWYYDHPSFTFGGGVVDVAPQLYGPDTPNIYKNWLAYVLRGSATSTSAVGRLVNFYNENDWALSAPVWQFNQITKPDYPDPVHPFSYSYAGDPTGFDDLFQKTDSSGTPIALHLGTRTDPKDRYEIMAFAAESRVKATGATANININQGISLATDLQATSVWPFDAGQHKAHKWHSGEFRSTIIDQRQYWKTLLSRDAFNIPTVTLP